MPLILPTQKTLPSGLVGKPRRPEGAAGGGSRPARLTETPSSRIPPASPMLLRCSLLCVAVLPAGVHARAHLGRGGVARGEERSLRSPVGGWGLGSATQYSQWPVCTGGCAPHRGPFSRCCRVRCWGRSVHSWACPAGALGWECRALAVPSGRKGATPTLSGPQSRVSSAPPPPAWAPLRSREHGPFV